MVQIDVRGEHSGKDTSGASERALQPVGLPYLAHTVVAFVERTAWTMSWVIVSARDALPCYDLVMLGNMIRGDS